MDEETGLNIEKTLLAAEGYSQLGMPDEALEELDQIPRLPTLIVPVEKLRLQVQMRASRYEAGATTAGHLCEVDAGDADNWIQQAFCLHEIGRTREAREVLHAGPASLTTKAIYFYNLACYDAVLGEIEESQHHLRRAFELDAQFREYARRDPDLVNVRDLL